MQQPSYILKKVGLLFVFCFSSSFTFAQQEEVPRILLFFGRFHPVLLHIPIGVILVTFFIDIKGRIEKKYPSNVVRSMIGFAAIFGVITSVLGYLLSLEGGYANDTLDYHFYLGIASSFLIVCLFILSKKPDFQFDKVFISLFILSIISIGITGHFGSILTHGENFITEYAKPAKKSRTIESVDSLKLYDDVVANIFDQKCYQCHNNSKKKGELSLITKEGILKGGETGEAISIGNAHKSLLYEQLLLPISDDEHMPPEGKSQLSKDEIWMLKYWIDNGLDFDGYAQNIHENDTLKRILTKYLVFDKKNIPKADPDDIAELQSLGFMVNERVPGSSELEVKYVNPVLEKSQLNKISSIKKQIIELDLSSTNLTDRMTDVLKNLSNLEMLRLDNTTISDKTLKNLRNLKNLKVLNLFSTNISNEGLEQLLKSITPTQIYTSQTKVDRQTALNLQNTYATQIHTGIAKGFIEKSQLEMPILSPNKTLFVDSIALHLDSKLRDVKIRYTLTGEDPDSLATLYTNPVILENSKYLKVRAFKEGWYPSNVLERQFSKIKQKVSSFTIVDRPDQRYPNAQKLFDLEEGSSSFNDGKWTGYLGTDINTTIDLGSIKIVDHISINCLENVGNWILFPKQLKVYAATDKSKDFKEIGSIKITRKGMGGDPEIKKVTLDIPQTSAQFFRIEVTNFGVLPTWHPGAGNDSWVFIDEIFLW